MKDNSVIEGVAAKFRDPLLTADGMPRARVALTRPRTLWFNTGTLCNITCANCYIESSPENDRLVYISAAEVAAYLDQMVARGWPVEEIGFTGGEPFMNPEIVEMIEVSLSRGYEVLVLTNAMRPMMRSKVQECIVRLSREYGTKFTLRVSLDHWSAACHDTERGAGSYEKTLAGMRWLRDAGVRMTVAGRTMWGEAEALARAGYAALFREEGFDIDAQDAEAMVLFPEMDERADVPEITTACWDLLGKSPGDVMCASSRMVVKRRGAARPAVVACTLLPYDSEFELGETLAEAEGEVALNHAHCARFCVLGGASCSA